MKIIKMKRNRSELPDPLRGENYETEKGNGSNFLDPLKDENHETEEKRVSLKDTKHQL